VAIIGDRFETQAVFRHFKDELRLSPPSWKSSI
jgi:hypothetical protein